MTSARSQPGASRPDGKAHDELQEDPAPQPADDERERVRQWRIREGERGEKPREAQQHHQRAGPALRPATPGVEPDADEAPAHHGPEDGPHGLRVLVIAGQQQRDHPRAAQQCREDHGAHARGGHAPILPASALPSKRPAVRPRWPIAQDDAKAAGKGTPLGRRARCGTIARGPVVVTRRSRPWPRSPSPRSPARRRRPSAGSARSRRRSPTATRPPPRRSSPPTATGATSSPSRGTSRPSRARRASPTWSSTRPGTTGAHGFHVTEPAAEADGVTEAWIAFETEVGRGSGHLRLKEGKAWTLLTTLDELKGHEEPARAGPAARRRARRRARPRDLARARAGARPRSWGHHAALRPHHRRRAGRHRAGRAPAPARRPDRHRRPPPAARRPVAQPLQVALPARPGLVRPPAVHQVPRELAGVLAEGQDRRLARDVHAGDGAQLLGLDRGQERELGSRGAGVDRAGRARRAAR